jgi:GntR family transcriptional regulator, transcriptional repressor for pyruvate dehydrogenase complex
MSPRSDPAFTPVRTRRVYQEICSQVRRRLARGQLKPGDKLPPERDLAIELGVSRGAVREALRSLENAGVVALRSGSRGGAFIREGDPSSLTQPLGDLMALGQLSGDGLVEARMQINDITVRLACARRTQGDLDALRACIESIEDSSDTPAALATQAKFLQRIAAASGSPLWSALVESLESLAGARDQLPEVQVEALKRILRALLRRQPGEAGKAMREALTDRDTAGALH